MVGPLDAFTGGGVNLGRVERGSVGGTWHDLTNKRWWKKGRYRSRFCSLLTPHIYQGQSSILEVGSWGGDLY